MELNKNFDKWSSLADDFWEYLFLNRTIIDWHQLPAGLLAPFPCNLSTFRKRTKKVVATKEPK
jgi:hypothetical protein